MAFDLTTIQARAAALLMDTGNELWSAADVTNAVRMALYEMSLAAGSPLTLSGLDMAASTTVPALLEGALIVGAAGYAAAARQADKADFEVASEAKELKPWAEARLREFRSMLEQMYPAGSARLANMRSSSSPWSSWKDDFGEKDRYQTS
jgi:hypothetical protein